MLGYQAWEPFKADLDLDLGGWKAWKWPNLAAGKALAATTATTTTATGLTELTGGTGGSDEMTTVDNPPARRGLLSPALRVPLLKSKFESQTSSIHIPTSASGPLTDCVRITG